MAFKKFASQSHDQHGRPVFWHRASVDGAPFRGNELALLRSHELEKYTEEVVDVGYGLFDTSLPEQTHFGCTLQQVLEADQNGLWHIAQQEKFKVWKGGPREPPTMFMWLIWSMPFMELSPEAQHLMPVQTAPRVENQG